MIKLSQALIPLFAIGLTLALISTLAPLYAEWSGDTEREIQAKLDAESCPGTQYQKIDGVIYCEYKGRLVKPKDYERLIR